jgi:hypothetical protein
MGKKSRNKSKKLTKEQNRKLNIRRNEIRKNVEIELAERAQDKLLETMVVDSIRKSVNIYTHKYFTSEKDLLVDEKEAEKSKKYKKSIKKGNLMQFVSPLSPKKVLFNKKLLRSASARFVNETMIGFDFDTTEAEDMSFFLNLQFYIVMITENPKWTIGENHASCWVDIKLDLSCIKLGRRRIIVAYFPYDIVGKGHDNSIIFMDYYGEFKKMCGKWRLKDLTDDYKYEWLIPKMEEAGYPATKSNVDELSVGFARDGIIDNCIAHMISQNYETQLESEHKKEQKEKKQEEGEQTHAKFFAEENQDDMDVNDDSDEDYDTCDEYEEMIVD